MEQGNNIEMLEHIKCLEEETKCLQKELWQENCNKFELPYEPIRVAEMLIDAEYSYKNKFTGMQHRGHMYCKSDLRQIAWHLLVYCNNSEDE